MLDSYFIHYSPLSERLANYYSIRNKFPFPISLITEHDLTIDIPEPFASIDTLSSQILPIYPLLVLHQLFLGTPNSSLSFIKPLYLSSLCDPSRRHLFYSSILRQAESSFSLSNRELCHQHYEAITRFYLSSDKPFCLILEDDSIFVEDYDLLQGVLNDLVNNYSDRPLFLDISNSLCLDRLYKKKLFMHPTNSLFHRVLFGQTRCSSAYILNKLAAQLILKFKHFLLPIDWHLSYALSVSSISTYWTCSPLFLQGSQDDSFSSNMESRNS